MLHAKPEDRRAFIEEAAGVLKHRKRKEKALRKLDAMQANLNRLTDLTAELRRQLKPLGRQAEVARRAAGIQADLRDARLRLLADDLHTLRTTLDKEIADETALRERREQVEARARRGAGPARPSWRRRTPRTRRCSPPRRTPGTSSPRCRSGSAPPSSSPRERLRHLSAAGDDERPGRDPDQLERRGASGSASRRRSCARRSTDDQVRLAEAVEHRQELERQLAAAERALVAAAKAIADRREGLAKLTGQVNAARARTTRAGEEIERLAAAHADALARAEQAQAELDAVAERVHRGRPGQRRPGRPARRGGGRARAGRGRASRELADAERAAEKDAAELEGPRGGARARPAPQGRRRRAAGPRRPRCPACWAASPALLTVDPGHEAALAAALGGLADAVAVTGVDEAVEAMRAAQDRRRRPGRAAGRQPGRARHDRLAGRAAPGCPTAPAGRPTWCDCADAAAPGAAPGAARRGARRRPGRRAPTLVAAQPGAARGHPGRRRARRVRGGRRVRPRRTSYIEVQAAVEEARAKRGSTPSGPVAELRDQLADARAEVADAQGGGAASPPPPSGRPRAQRNAAARRLAELGAAARSAKAETERLGAARAKAEAARERDLAGLAELEERLRLAEDTPIDEDPSTEERDQLAALVPQARQNEMEVRLAVRTAEERVASIAGRADSLARQATAERAARERAAARRAARARGAGDRPGRRPAAPRAR